MWFSETEKGTFWIRFVPEGRGAFVLGIDDLDLGTYFSPEAAADDVYLQKTGFAPWDQADGVPKPDSLSEWKRFDCADWDASRKPINPVSLE